MLARDTYLNLQDVVTSDALVVHLMIGIVSIPTRFILHERETGANSQNNQDLFSAGAGRTYRRDEADRGAGMSQRTRRPYLRVEVRLGVHRRIAGRTRNRERGGRRSRSVEEDYLHDGRSEGGIDRSIGSGRKCNAEEEQVGESTSRIVEDVPFEFVCEVAGAGSVREAGHVECGATAARHLDEAFETKSDARRCKRRVGGWMSRQRRGGVAVIGQK